jgi:alpha-1,2-mannosyltransferase
VAFSLLSWTSHGVSLHPYRLDLEIYRIGGRVWLSGGNLYGALPATSAGALLPFTYPPFAAIVLSPLSLIPMVAADLVITVGTIAALAVTLKAFAGPVAWPLPRLLPIALVLEPARSTIVYGQINVLLMALVAMDCLAGNPSQPGIPDWPGRTRWPRGLLAGLAAAVKLTPALFVLYFLLQRNYRAAGVMAAAFLSATGLGFLLAPRDSTRYWSSVVFETRRIGGLAYAGNQNIVGALARAGLVPGTLVATVTWLGLSMLVMAVACRGMWRAFAAGQDSLALTLNAFAALLISPVSWSHHWVWAEMALLVIATLGRQRQLRVASITAVAGLVIFAASPQWWFPHGANKELEWTVWQQAIGSSYVYFAAFYLLLCLRLTLTRPADTGQRAPVGIRTRRCGMPARGREASASMTLSRSGPACSRPRGRS